MYRKKRFFVGYDISKNKGRTKIQKKLDAYGVRWQYSNYLCEFFPKDLEEVRKFCEKWMEKDDTVVWIPISDPLLKKIHFQGTPKNRLDEAEPTILS